MARGNPPTLVGGGLVVGASEFFCDVRDFKKISDNTFHFLLPEIALLPFH